MRLPNGASSCGVTAGDALHVRRGREVGRHVVDPDVVRAELDGERATELLDRGLRRRVHREAGCGTMALDRREVDDAPTATAGPHAGHRQRTGVEHVHEVHAQQGIPTLRAGLDERGGERASRHVDQRVEPAPARIHRLEQRGELLRLAHVAVDHDRPVAEVAAHLVDRVRIDVEHREMHAVRGEIPGDRAAKTTAAAGHDRDRPRETAARFEPGAHCR